MRTAVFSIVAPNRRHYARVLMQSVAQHEPTWDRVVLVVAPEAAPDPSSLFQSVALESLPLPEPRRFLFRYTVLELCTAVKPWMFAHLFAQGYDRVVYLDPDIVLYTPLIELDEVPSDTLMALTPHLTGPIDGDAQPSERGILQSGAYNLGFLAVWRRPEHERFLAWWQARLETQCVVERERGLFVDQKWLDLAPGLFPGVVVLRHEGWNVAYWNLRQRRVRQDAAGLTVNGVPLRFFHFSGALPARPQLVSAHDQQLTLDVVGAAGPLVRRFRAALREQGQVAAEVLTYPYDTFADGTPVSDAARIAYRRSPDLQRACGENPFARPGCFRRVRDGWRRPTTSRLALLSYRLLSRPRVLLDRMPQSVKTAVRELLLGAPPRT